MSGTDRRGFLRGLFGGVAAGGLIVSATPREIEAFTAPMTKGQPLLIDKPPVSAVPIYSGLHLYNAEGEVVAYVTQITATNQMVDVTSYYDVAHQFCVDGPPRIEIRAEGICGVEFRGGQPRLRGRK